VLGEGRFLFGACERGLSAEAILRVAAMTPETDQILDADEEVALAIWRK
jgi:hypothetical protein